jgi:hypothetical protein
MKIQKIKALTLGLIVINLLNGVLEAQPQSTTSPSAFTLFGRALSDADKNRNDMGTRDILVSLYSHLPTATRGQREDIQRYKDQFKNIYNVDIDDLVRQRNEETRQHVTRGFTTQEEMQQLRAELAQWQRAHEQRSKELQDLQELIRLEEQAPPAPPAPTVPEVPAPTLPSKAGLETYMQNRLDTINKYLSGELIDNAEGTGYLQQISELGQALKQYLVRVPDSQRNQELVKEAEPLVKLFFPNLLKS